MLSIIYTFLLLGRVTATPPLPRLLISLTPIFSTPTTTSSTSGPEITALNVTLVLTGAPYTSPLLSHLLNNGATRTINATLSASDSTGPLSLSTHVDKNTSNAIQFWSVPSGRNIVGDITVRFLAEVPPGLGIGNGPRIDLRRDQGGLIGLGEVFLPRPAVDEEWVVIVRWENTDAYPNGIRAVSSLGEGHEVRAQGRPGRIVDKTYFAVRRLGRWPPWGEDEGQSQSQSENEGPFAMYWVREAPPWDLDRLGERIKMLTAAVRNFFGEGKDSFRMFWHRAARGYGGAGGFRSFMMEFTSLAGEELSIDELENLISHESVHGYALMNSVRQQDVWYREGVATYYAVMAPFLAGVVDGDYFVRCMNNSAQAYYTGGTTGLNWTYVLQNYWTNTPLVHGLVQQATDGTKGLDDVVLALYQRYKTDAVTQGEQFVAAVAEYVGNTTAAASFEDMTSGKLVIPATDSFAKYGLKLARQDAEKLELGFSEASFGGVIIGLVAGSRAEEAGIREGDKVVRFWSFSTAADSLDNKMKVVIERDDQQSTITYSPRSRNKVECYQWVRMGAA